MAEPSQTAPASRAWLFWLFATLLGTYLLSAGGHLTASDDVQKLQALDGLWKRWDPAIPDGWAPGPDGRTYSWFPLGSSLLMAPAYLSVQLVAPFLPPSLVEPVLRFAVALQNAPIVAALATSLAWLAWRWGVQARWAALAALGYGLGSMAWPYAKSGWSEPAAALALLWALVWLWEGVPLAGEALRPGRILAAASALAIASSLRLELILVAPGAFGWLGHRRAWAWGDLGRILLWLLGPLLLAGLLTLAYNAARFGHPFALPAFSSPVANSGPKGPWARSLMGLKNLWAYSLHPGRGLLIFNPMLLAATLGWGALWRRQPELSRLLLLALGPMALFYAFAWPGSSFAWGPRYFFVFTPVLALGTAWALQGRGWRRRAAAMALGLGLGVQLLAVTVNPVPMFEDVVATKPGVNLLHRFDEPAAYPVPLAAGESPRRWREGLAVLAQPPAPALWPAEAARQRMRWLPDLWPFLLLWSPLPRGIIFGAWAFLALLTLMAAVALALALRPDQGRLQPA